MLKNYLPLLLFTFLLAFTACDDNDEDKYSIELDREAIAVDIKGGSDYVSITTNGEWEIQGIPEWMTVSQTMGNTSTEISLLFTENGDDNRRKATLLFVSGSVSKPLEIEQLGMLDVDPFIEFSKTKLLMTYQGEFQKIKLTTNRKWKISTMPTWVSVSPSAGDKSTEIVITTNENYNPDGRETQLEFEADGVKGKVAISQNGLKDVISSPVLYFIPYTKISSQVPLREVTVETFQAPVSAESRDNIFLGNLISHKTQSSTNIPTFTGYTFNPITVSTSVPVSGIVSTTFIPSLKEQEAYARQIIEQRPKQIESFQTDDGRGFYDYKWLHALGLTSLGVKLDELISGAPYTEKAMTRKYGLLFSFRKVLFGLDMDIPPNRLIKEDLKEADRAQGVSYISSVKYGKIGLLILETDTDSRLLLAAVRGQINDEPLTANQTALIRAADITYIYFDNNKQVKVKKGGVDALNAYKNALLNEPENMYPVGFSVANFEDHSMQPFTFIYKVEDAGK